MKQNWKKKSLALICFAIHIVIYNLIHHLVNKIYILGKNKLHPQANISIFKLIITKSNKYLIVQHSNR